MGKWTMDTKSREIVLVEKDYSFQKVRGQRVRVKGFEDVEFYVYCVSESGTPTYAVAERTGGVMVSTVERTKKGAIESCIEHIKVFEVKNSEEFMDKLIEIAPFQVFAVVAKNSKGSDEEEEEEK